MWGSKEKVREMHTDPDDRAYGNQLTFGALDYAARQILMAGHSVIYDANANKPDERLKLAQIAHDQQAIPVVVRLRTPIDLAIRRIAEREDSHDQNKHGEDHAREVVRQFAEVIVEPDHSENVIEVSGEQSFDEQYQAFTSSAIINPTNR